MRNQKGLGLILIIEICLLAIILVFKYLIPEAWIMEVKTVVLVLLGILLISKIAALFIEEWDSTIIYLFINLMISLIFLLSLWFAESSSLLLGVGAAVLTFISLMLVASENSQFTPNSKERTARIAIVEDIDDEENKILKNLEELHELKKKEARLEEKEKYLEQDVKELQDQVANIKPVQSIKTTRKKKEKILVFVSKNGKKYHNKDCILAAKIPKEARIVYNSEKEALKKGYSPCRVCTPGK